MQMRSHQVVRRLKRIERELREVEEYCKKYHRGFTDIRWAIVYIRMCIKLLEDN